MREPIFRKASRFPFPPQRHIYPHIPLSSNTNKPSLSILNDLTERTTRPNDKTKQTKHNKNKNNIFLSSLYQSCRRRRPGLPPPPRAVVCPTNSYPMLTLREHKLVSCYWFVSWYVLYCDTVLYRSRTVVVSCCSCCCCMRGEGRASTCGDCGCDRLFLSLLSLCHTHNTTLLHTLSLLLHTL